MVDDLGEREAPVRNQLPADVFAEIRVAERQKSHHHQNGPHDAAARLEQQQRGNQGERDLVGCRGKRRRQRPSIGKIVGKGRDESDGRDRQPRQDPVIDWNRLARVLSIPRASPDGQQHQHRRKEHRHGTLDVGIEAARVSRIDVEKRKTDRDPADQGPSHPRRRHRLLRCARDGLSGRSTHAADGFSRPCTRT